MSEMLLYFVKGVDSFGWCITAGHYLASSPKEAIELFVSASRSNPHTDISQLNTLRFSAKRSKCDPAAMALNY